MAKAMEHGHGGDGTITTIITGVVFGLVSALPDFIPALDQVFGVLTHFIQLLIAIGTAVLVFYKVKEKLQGKKQDDK